MTAAMHRHMARAERFARTVLESGLPLLGGALASLECTRHTAFEAGDHTIVVGEVTAGSGGDGRPLLYDRGGHNDLPT